MLFRKYILFSLFILLYFAGNKLFAQTTIDKIKHYTIDNGLSQTHVTCVYKDSYGFLWVGTQDGLNRFDGYEFRKYGNQPMDSTSINEDFIYSVSEDHDSNIWVATSKGVSKYLRGKNTFVNYSYDESSESKLPEQAVYKVLVDKKGDIWLKTNRFLCKYNRKTDRFDGFEHYFDPFTYQESYLDADLYEDQFSNLWVGGKDGLFLFDKQLQLFQRFVKKENNSLKVHKITELDGNLFVSSESGGHFFNKDFQSFEEQDSRMKYLSKFEINVALKDSKGDSWYGTENGLLYFHEGKWTEIKHFYDNSHKKGFRVVTSLIEDDFGVIWIGTEQGLFKLDLKPSKVNMYALNSEKKALFGSNDIASILSDGRENIWIGTWGQGLYKYNRKTKKSISFTSSNGNQLKNDYVHSMHVSSSNRLCLGTRDGIQIFNPRKQKFEEHWNKLLIESLKDKRIYDFLEDKKGRTWIGTSYGAYLLSNSDVRAYGIADRTTDFASKVVRSLHQDKHGTIWLGTTNGLYKYIEDKDQFLRFYPSRLSCNEITCIRSDSESLWVGTNTGLNKINLDTEEVYVYSEMNGIPNNLVYSVVPYKSDVWISTNHGIARIDKETNRVYSFSVSDGLQSYEFNLGASYLCPVTNEIFFGGINGVNYLNPDSIAYNHLEPQVGVGYMELFSSDSTNEVMVKNQQKVTIDNHIYRIVIHLFLSDFTRSDKNTYSYQVNDGDWQNIGKENQISLFNLPPGEYHFKIKGSNGDGVWGAEYFELDLIVKGKIWNSPYAYFLYILVALIIIYGYIVHRTKGLKMAKQALKEKEFAHEELAQQKEELTIKNKNITDSLNYARRIQKAMLPSERLFYSLLPDSFVLFKPKDIVSGDFFWVHETSDKIFVSAIDCTGHGVPGAFMSIIGVELLRNIIDTKKVYGAAEILNELNKGVIDTFSRHEQDAGLSLKDGMDCSFCVIDKKSNVLDFAGAFNPLYIVRNNQIEEVKGDRFAVGSIEEGEQKSFTPNRVELQKDDMLYMFTDGYVDQFGGPDGKKYKFRRFRHLLLNIHKLHAEVQSRYLDESIEAWKGSNEQVDDILIIGIKPSFIK